MTRTTLSRWILLAGLAFVFLYFGIDKFVHPKIWIGWMPDRMDGLLGIGNDRWLSLIGATEIAIGVMLLIPIRIVQKVGTALAVLHLLGILTQVGWNDIAVRDIGLLLMGAALWFLI